MTTTAERRRATRARQGGQILVLLVLVMTTMGAAAFVSITFGQAVVRRHKAQLVVDAAALAGAAEQAKGLNTIARINEKQFNILNAILHAQKLLATIGYTDSVGTTAGRSWGYNLFKDWAYESWESYESQVFQPLNRAAQAVNLAYGPYLKPRRAAKKVVDDNFRRGGGGLFSGEHRAPRQEVVVSLTEIASSYQLVKLTRPREYEASGFRRYKPNSGYYGEYCVEYYGYVPNPPCIFEKNKMKAAYKIANATFLVSAFFDRPKYHLGQFYDNPAGRDVRFTYALGLPAAEPLIGDDFFHRIPPIIVVASAKPYQGHLGAEFQTSWLGRITRNIAIWDYNQQKGKEIAYTYKAKLVPVRTAEKSALAMMRFDTGGVDDRTRYFTTFH